MTVNKNLAGQRFGKLVAIECRAQPLGTQGRRQYRWRCLCDCGNETEVLSWHLSRGKTSSCGCLRLSSEAHWNRTHGGSGGKDPLYRVWWSMISRCTYPTVSNYKYYGGRGIRVCDRWRHGDGEASGFECFRSDMGPRPEGHSIDRINNDGNYEPANCKWSTHSEQVINSRHHMRKAS